MLISVVRWSLIHKIKSVREVRLRQSSPDWDLSTVSAPDGVDSAFKTGKCNNQSQTVSSGEKKHRWQHWAESEAQSRPMGVDWLLWGGQCSLLALKPRTMCSLITIIIIWKISSTAQSRNCQSSQAFTTQSKYAAAVQAHHHRCHAKSENRKHNHSELVRFILKLQWQNKAATGGESLTVS